MMLYSRFQTRIAFGNHCSPRIHQGARRPFILHRPNKMKQRKLPLRSLVPLHIPVVFLIMEILPFFVGFKIVFVGA